MAEETKGIFICYRRDESAGYAGRIGDSFVAHFGEDSVFRDIDTLEPGIEFAEAIDKAVSSSAVLIAVIGPNWSTAKDETSQKRLENPDDWVRREIAMALERKLRVIPLLLPGAAIPSEEELPDDLAPLARRNVMQLHDATWREQVERLMNTLAKFLGRESVNREELLQAEVARLREEVSQLEETRSEAEHLMAELEESREAGQRLAAELEESRSEGEHLMAVLRDERHRTLVIRRIAYLTGGLSVLLGVALVLVLWVIISGAGGL
jgi:TIR domain